MSRYFEAPRYITLGDMSQASVSGGAIQVGPRGDVVIIASWQNTGTPVGAFSLQFQRLDGTLLDVPGSVAEFTANGNSQPNNDNKTIVCHWSNLRVYEKVFLKYTRASGGAANTTLTAEAFSD
jgi:hypothetical protein